MTGTASIIEFRRKVLRGMVPPRAFSARLLLLGNFLNPGLALGEANVSLRDWTKRSGEPHHDRNDIKECLIHVKM